MNPNGENVNDKGRFSLDVANNVPSMLRIIVLFWFVIAVVGVTLIFPFKQEKMTEDLIINDSLNKSENGSHASIND